MTPRMVAQALGIALAMGWPVAPQDPVFRSAADSVIVDVSVRSGRSPVRGLTAADFELRDNGVRQAITDVSYETMPIGVTFVVDVSGSVRGPLLDNLARALDRVRGRLRPDDRSTVVLFNEEIRAVLEGQRGSSTPALEPVGPMGLTAIFDALTVSLISRDDPDRRAMVILFTDGNDTISFVDEKILKDVVRQTRPAVFFVAAVDGGHAPHQTLFDEIARTSGGRVEVIDRVSDVSASFLAAVDEFRASYVLRYALQGVKLEGWHDIGVRVTRPGKYDVRARKGYVGKSGS